MYYLGIDLGGTNIAAGIVGEKFNIVKKGSIPTLAEREPELIIKDMADLCMGLIQECGLKMSDAAYAGLAIPGTVNYEAGCSEDCHNLPTLDQFPIVSTLKKRLNLENVYIENDANAAAKGEAFAGAAKDCDHAIMITIGTGVGSGVIIDKKIYSGYNYSGSELGHIVIEYNGRLCGCGKKGCWEAYSSATGLIKMTAEKLDALEAAGENGTVMHRMKSENGGSITAKMPFDAMRTGDKAAAEVVDMYIGYLACGLVNVINIYQPEVLCISGGICNEGDTLMIPALKIINREQYTRTSGVAKTQIKISALGNDAGIIGAAVLGL